jgi:hypothetical protein
MHFGAEVADYRGSPAGWVLEPMNLCLEPFPGKPVQRDQDWVQFARSLIDKKVRAVGVPRIWPEHLDGDESASNPNHALELHPLTSLSGVGPARDFSKFVYAPDTYQGGVSCKTAETILQKTKVGVTRRDDEVEVDFDAGRIGNFTVVDIRVRKDNIQPVSGGHRLDGEVLLESGESLPVRMISVAGSRFDTRMGRFRTGQRRTARLEVLVLFSLDPKALFEVARQSFAGQRREVPQPLQLIVYGVTDAGCR